MIGIFVGLFFLGLIAAVRVMLYGVERPRAVGDATPRSFSASPAVMASFAVVTGIVGYGTLRAGVAATICWATALLAGSIAAFGTSRAIARWWTVVPEHDVDDERYVLQGSLGRVVASIGSTTPGQIALEGTLPQKIMTARTIDDQPIPQGTEVVIERIEDGVAFVEDWAAVEKRL